MREKSETFKKHFRLFNDAISRHTFLDLNPIIINEKQILGFYPNALIVNVTGTSFKLSYKFNFF